MLHRSWSRSFPLSCRVSLTCMIMLPREIQCCLDVSLWIIRRAVKKKKNIYCLKCRRQKPPPCSGFNSCACTVCKQILLYSNGHVQFHLVKHIWRILHSQPGCCMSWQSASPVIGYLGGMVLQMDCGNMPRAKLPCGASAI